MERIILHLDMDYFFAQIEERENPQFKGKLVVVGADPKGGKGRGVVSTANYLARKYGIHSALPISKAYELCPNAIFLPVNMELYQKVSENIMEIVKKYSPKWETVSLDEAYLDVSFLKGYKGTKRGATSFPRKGEEGGGGVGVLAEKLKKEILEKEKLTCTVGIGPNKLIAKMAAQIAKPNGLLIIKPNQVEKFLEPLDIEDLPGIGPKTAEKLRIIRINKIKELKKLSKAKLKDMFGVVGETIYERVRGIDEEVVTSEEIIKSIGKEHTFEKDTRDPEIIFGKFEEIIEEIGRGLSSANFSFRTITVICRFSGFETHTKSKTEPRPLKMDGAKVKMRTKSSLPTLKNPTQDFEILKSESKKLLLKFLIENPKPIRLIGLRVRIC
ncbi:MAG: hypothetical protein AUK06_01560 [Parcubacteria group bacterium CG2_30_36_18]|uniref:DNA polymerase IV n=2 Tax=Candidatus Nealsoniibacteriota TaxID=1817911 RepID=A0A2M8DLZ8_9BACT|nr:MAG: hypothetical protein AUK06_01560 [Parcubacteria group bacterium CG2_30_36_18]PIR72538.1 MAG: DNA polymerase IV [Candidatus Nealsonbacteria bacterium CG10_big_fil_rev_8_21_14_0_10_36_228]PJB98935.1 MAG: DNA polymerase IV [Candidatus Nealsonbacteria bacterium CG_4_9_14_0_8_um_filter_36_17]